MAFKKGHKLAKGGKREGAGRKPDWLREKCQNIVSDKKIIERLAQIAAGELVDTTTTIDGRLIPVPAPMAAQVKAAAELLDRGFGKSVQTIAGDPERPLISSVALLPLQSKGESGGIVD